MNILFLSFLAFAQSTSVKEKFTGWLDYFQIKGLNDTLESLTFIGQLADEGVISFLDSQNKMELMTSAVDNYHRESSAISSDHIKSFLGDYLEELVAEEVNLPGKNYPISITEVPEFGDCVAEELEEWSIETVDEAMQPIFRNWLAGLLKLPVDDKLARKIQCDLYIFMQRFQGQTSKLQLLPHMREVALVLMECRKAKEDKVVKAAYQRMMLKPINRLKDALMNKRSQLCQKYHDQKEVMEALNGFVSLANDCFKIPVHLMYELDRNILIEAYTPKLAAIRKHLHGLGDLERAIIMGDMAKILLAQHGQQIVSLD